jgi:OTU domain-containing protein 3
LHLAFSFFRPLPLTLQAGRKGRGGHWETQLATELSHLGLRVHEVAADGSCFFRSLADQLEGRFRDHCYLRKTIVQHIKTNRDLYEPFIEDDEPFDEYVESMEEEGTWAGNLELQAASIQLKVNLKIYQAGQPPWIVKNFSTEEVPMLHISYHDGMHYNSVRLLDDYGTGPPEPIPIHNSVSRDCTSTNRMSSRGCTYVESDVRRVQDGTGCNDDELLVAALEKVGGDVDAAIEALVEELHGEESGMNGNLNDVGGLEEGNELSTRLEGTAELLQNTDLDKESCEIIEKFVKVELEVSRGGKGKRVRLHLHMNKEDREAREEDGASNKEKQDSEKNIILTKKKKKKNSSTLKKQKGTENKDARQPPLARNSKCPCGSTKKYKNCCGASKAARVRTTNIDGSGCFKEEDKSVAQVGAAMETLYI